MRTNGLQIGAGREFTHESCYEELNFQYTTFLSYEALKPCLSLFAVSKRTSFCRAMEKMRFCKVLVLPCFV
jgi:hypothetical protein